LEIFFQVRGQQEFIAKVIFEEETLSSERLANGLKILDQIKMNSNSKMKGNTR